MTPSSNQFSDCNTCAQFNNCPTSCGQVVTQVTVAQPQILPAVNCQTCVQFNNCPSTCGVVQQPAADPTKLSVTPIQSVSPSIIGTVACGCLSAPVCACRGTVLMEEKEEEKKEEEKCGCMSAPVCGCRPTTYVAPELSNNCGCSVCPCSNVQTILTTTTLGAGTCGCSVCPCITQYVQPEIVDPVPCGCIALGPSCPCFNAGIQVVGCPCRGQLGCGCI